MGVRFVSIRDSLLLVYSFDDKGSCPHREASASEVFPNGMGRIAGLYHVKNENLVESDAVDLKISISGDDSMSLYRIAQIRDYYYVFDSYFLGGEQHPVNLWISTSIPISDELFRETGLIGDILERDRMGYDPVVIGGKHPDAMPMAFFFSKPIC
ncbi:MAG: hypothetical protein CVV46_15520 [Spirochaetae bacterium HGW-Spirochaetae-2]|jgi:hypothetical protein|nr:MAG: hypothetical protein CVV46_15520 [Spirochaetae bacterium HGW-Spirochaetae-2]